MKKLNQIDKLLKVKQLRRRLAEMEAAKARRFVHNAELELQDARIEEQTVRETSTERRNERLKKVVEISDNPAVQNARLVNVYAITDQEIQNANFNTTLHIQKLDEASDRLKLEQQKLARFLQLEERTRKLCDRLLEMKKVEAVREG